MATRDVMSWETEISQVVSSAEEEEIIIRGRKLSELIGTTSFSEVIFLMLQGRLPAANEARVLDALLVASIDHGIAPPSMVSRCFASYGTSLQVAIGASALAFGDRMGGLGEQLARTMVDALAGESEGGAEVPDTTLRARANTLVDAARAGGERVPGYGIPLHAADPRSPRLLEVARNEGTYRNYCRLAEHIGEALARARGGRAVPMNLDGVGAAVILDLGFSWQSTRMFLITARTVSAAAHFLEEREQDTTWRHIPAANISYQGPPAGSA